MIMKGSNSIDAINLCSSDEESVDSNDVEIIKVINSREKEIIVIGSESEDSGKGGDDISGPIRTTRLRDITRDKQFYPNFGIKRYNGSRESDWKASNLWATPKRTKPKIGSLQETRGVTDGNANMWHDSGSPWITQVTPEDAKKNQRNTGEDSDSIDGKRKRYAAGLDPINDDTEGFTSMNRDKSVCRTNNIRVSHTSPMRKLNFNERSDLSNTHQSPANGSRMGKVKTSTYLRDNYQDGPVSSPRSDMNYEGHVTLKDPPESKVRAQAHQEESTDVQLKSPPELKRTAETNQDIIMSENNDEFEDDQTDNYIRNYTSLSDGTTKTSTEFPTGGTPDEAPTPQTRKNNYPNARMPPDMGSKWMRLQARKTQTCGRYCPEGIKLDDFIEKLESGVLTNGSYQFWRHWNCSDPRGESFNCNTRRRTETTPTVPPTTTSPAGSSHADSQVGAEKVNGFSSTVNSQTEGLPGENTRNANNTSGGSQLNCMSPEQCKRAESKKREALKRRMEGAMRGSQSGTQVTDGWGINAGPNTENAVNERDVKARKNDSLYRANQGGFEEKEFIEVTGDDRKENRCQEWKNYGEGQDTKSHTSHAVGTEINGETEAGKQPKSTKDTRADSNNTVIKRNKVTDCPTEDGEGLSRQVSRRDNRSYKNNMNGEGCTTLNLNTGPVANEECSVSRETNDNKKVKSLGAAEEDNNHSTTSEGSYAEDSWLDKGPAEDDTSYKDELNSSDKEEDSERAEESYSENSEEGTHDENDGDDGEIINDGGGKGDGSDVGVLGYLRRSTRIIYADTQPRYTETYVGSSESVFSDDYEDEEYEEDAFGDENDSGTSIHTETTGQNNARSFDNIQVGEHGASDITELDVGMNSDQIGVGTERQEAGSDTQRQIELEIIGMVPVRTDGQHTTLDLSNSNDSNIEDNQQHFTTNGEENNSEHSQLRGGRSGGGEACTIQTTIPDTIGFHERS